MSGAVDRNFAPCKKWLAITGGRSASLCQWKNTQAASTLRDLRFPILGSLWFPRGSMGAKQFMKGEHIYLWEPYTRWGPKKFFQSRELFYLWIPSRNEVQKLNGPGTPFLLLPLLKPKVRAIQKEVKGNKKCLWATHHPREGECKQKKSRDIIHQAFYHHHPHFEMVHFF